jgi:hypothetical protein
MEETSSPEAGMKRYWMYVLVGLGFVAVSAVLYLVHYLVFHDSHHIFIFMLHDFAFLPLEAFIVVIVIERVLARREKRAFLYKLNMVIGAFFTEVGNYLLGDMLKYIRNREEISSRLNIQKDWTARDFKAADEYANYLRIDVDMDRVDLEELKQYLHGRRFYLMTLLQNPSLLEHDRFTDLLWATTHLGEELEMRDNFDDLPPGDRAHLAVDIQRTYDNLTSEWLDYVQHLKTAYPFLFSLVLRTHPFQENPSPEVKTA